MWIMTNSGKLLERWRYQTILPSFSPEKPVCRSRATVRTLYGTTDWFKIEKGIQQGCLLSSCLFNLYAEHNMRNARLNKLQTRIKICGRNINNLRYKDNTTQMAESKEELKSLLMSVKESEKSQLKTKY